MLKLSLLTGGLLAASSLVATSVHAAEVSGEMLAQTCSGCHGTFGKIKNSAFMPLAGMNANTFVNTMKEFASGARPSTLMSSLAKGFTDDELKRMADYFAAQKL
ncbi:MAG: cytochrome C [Gammaproteobacteria bacterium]|nr:cytochrome C [Gammaproteobacteria bacterium]